MKRRRSKADKLAHARQRIEHSLKWRDSEGYDDLWDRMTDLYRGKHFEAATSEDQLAINIAFSTINVIYPSVSVNHPKVVVKARTEDRADQATIAEAVVNYWWRPHDYRRPFRQAVKDFLICGHGWLKVGYEVVDEEEPLSDNELEEAFLQKRDEVDAYASENPEFANELPTDEEIISGLPSTRVVRTHDHPYVERISPRDMVIDPDSTCEQDMRWLAQRVIRDLDEVRADERYVKAVREKVEPDAALRGRRDSMDDRWKKDPEVARVTVWEFYDLKDNTVCAFAEGGDRYLMEPEKIPFASGHPYVMLRNYEVPDQFYPMGELEQIEPLQMELNETRSQMMNHRRKYAPKWLYRSGSFGSAGRAALESRISNTFVPVEDENNPLSELIIPIPASPMDAGLYNYSEVVEADIDKVTGVNEYARGATPEIRRTATEAAIIQDNANARAADKLALIEGGISAVARKVVGLAQQFLSAEQAAYIVGPNDAQLWFTFGWKDVEGEFDFEVEGGSTEPLNAQTRRQEAISLLQAMGPLVGTVVDPYELTRHVLQYGFNVKNPEKFLMEQPPMMPPGPGGEPMPGDVPAEEPLPEEMAMADPMGGSDAVPEALRAQLMGQTGLPAPPPY